MRRLLKKLGMALSIWAVGIAAVALAAHVSFAWQSPANATKSPNGMETVAALTPFVEGPSHFDEKDPDGTIRSALSALGRENAAMIIFQILPDTFGHPGLYDVEALLSEVKKYPGKLA